MKTKNISDKPKTGKEAYQYQVSLKTETIPRKIKETVK